MKCKSGNQNENKNVCCVFCRSKNYIRKGHRQTEHRGKIQRYECKQCHKNFTHDEGFYRMCYSAQTITLSIDMYLSNLSSRKMRNQLKRHFSTKASHVSILDWVRKYALRVHNFVEKLGYNLGKSFFADETFIDRNGEDDRFWACVDWGTLVPCSLARQDLDLGDNRWLGLIKLATINN